MASFLHATDLGSDTDDEDYVPEGQGATGVAAAEAVSEEEDSGEDEGDDDADGKPKKKAKKKTKSKKKGAAAVPTARGAVLLGAEERKAEEERKKEFAREKEEIKAAEEKSKVDDLWADFKKDTAAKPKPKPKASNSAGGLGSLTSMSSSASKKQNAKSSSSSGKSTPRSIVSSIFDSIPDKKSEEAKASEKKKEEEEESSDPSKMKITRVFDFAGENVEITKEVAKDSKEAKKFLQDKEKSGSNASTSSSAGAGVNKRPGGIASIMGVISGKKQKMGCLDKSKLDWNSFVKEEGIREELQTHNKGKDGYVEKLEFLERADHRKFEMEKAAREKTRKTFNR